MPGECESSRKNLLKPILKLWNGRVLILKKDGKRLFN